MTHWGSRRQRGRSIERLEDRQLMAANTCQAIDPVMDTDESPLVVARELVEVKIETTRATVGPSISGDYYPAPDDDDGGWGPIGPVVRDAVRFVARDFAHRMFEDVQVAHRQGGGAGMPSPDDDTPWPPWIGPYVHDINELYIVTAMKIVADKGVNPEPQPWRPAEFLEHAQVQLMDWFANPSFRPLVSPNLAAQIGYPVDGRDDPGPDDPEFLDGLDGIANRFVEQMQQDRQAMYARGGGGVGLPADDDNSEWPPWIGPYVRTADELYLVVAHRVFQEMDANTSLDQLQRHFEEQLFLWFQDPDRELIVDGAVVDTSAVLQDAITRVVVPGDSNLDRVFNSSDLVKVFQYGEYEDGIANNSTWFEGDWNGDGDFDSSDLVLAFQLGHYENPSAHERAIDLVLEQA